MAMASEPWLSGRPPELLAGAGITLRRWTAEDAEELVEAVNETLDELSPWMPWAQQPTTIEGISAVISEADAAWKERREFAFTIRAADDRRALLGCCGLHDRIGAGALEVGYWLRTGNTGHGFATEAARLVTRAALDLGGVGRVEIHCDEANAPSAAIPRRLGYRLDRIEHRPRDAPGETDRQMIWIVAMDDVREGTTRR
jgi:RimJ/RimL family protein N-acetyltransferase